MVRRRRFRRRTCQVSGLGADAPGLEPGTVAGDVWDVTVGPSNRHRLVTVNRTRHCTGVPMGLSIGFFNLCWFADGNPTEAAIRFGRSEKEHSARVDRNWVCTVCGSQDLGSVLQ